MPQFAEPEYEQMFGAGTYVNATAKLYRGIKFRPGIVLFMEENTFIGDNCVILVPHLKMFKGSQIGAGTILAGRSEVILEENTVIGYNCTLLTATDTPRGDYMNDASPEKERMIIQGPIILRKNSFVGSNVTLMPNAEIGEASVVGAYSYIESDIPPNHKTTRYFQSLRRR